MKDYLRNHKGIAAICATFVLLALCSLWSLNALIRGNLAARIDIRRGRYQVLGFGLPVPSQPEYARCLRERYDIEFRAVAGCIVSDSLISYVNGYDSVVSEAASRRFGHEVFKECANETDRKWREGPEQTIKDVKSRQ